MRMHLNAVGQKPHHFWAKKTPVPKRIVCGCVVYTVICTRRINLPAQVACPHLARTPQCRIFPCPQRSRRVSKVHTADQALIPQGWRAYGQAHAHICGLTTPRRKARAYCHSTTAERGQHSFEHVQDHVHHADHEDRVGRVADAAVAKCALPAQNHAARETVIATGWALRGRMSGRELLQPVDTCWELRRLDTASCLMALPSANSPAEKTLSAVQTQPLSVPFTSTVQMSVNYWSGASVLRVRMPPCWNRVCAPRWQRTARIEVRVVDSHCSLEKRITAAPPISPPVPQGLGIKAVA